MMDVLFRTENFAKIYMEIGITADPTPRIVQIYRLKTKQRTNGMPPVIIAKVVTELMTFFSKKRKVHRIENFW
jgi:hypothetical protein